MDCCHDRKMESISRRLILAAFSLIIQTGCETPFAPTSLTPPAGKDPGPVQMGTLPREGFFNGATLKTSDVDSVVSHVQPGGVLIISEQHGNQKHYAHQKLALQALAKTTRCVVSVGLEFLAWTHQSAIADYFHGTLSETDFLKAAEWGGNPFVDYRDQALFPRSTGGELIGINAPKVLTSTISKKGLASLTPELNDLMPPVFELGSQAYRERFNSIMGGHVPAAALDRYFAAQSVWDDSMAWQSAEFLRSNPSHCLVVIVGDFHAAWGGGLPARLAARGLLNITVISQVETFDLSEVELSAELGPHPRFGSRADALWLSRTIPPQP